MSESRKKLFLTVIAKEKKMPSAKDVLAALISHSPIYAHVENVTLTSPTSSMDFAITDLPIPEMYLHILWSRGTWEGNRIEIRSFDVKAAEYSVTEAAFDKDLRLSVDDLFVYEHDLVDFEARNTDLFAGKPANSTRTEDSLYTLVGVFLDMLVDKKGKNIFPAPTCDSKYIFQNQADLIEHIQRYEAYGLKKSSLEEKFAKAHSILKEKGLTPQLG